MKYLTVFLLIICLFNTKSVLSQGQENEGGLWECARNGNVDCVQLAINAGDDLDLTGPYNQTPVAEAVREGHVNIAEMLIDAEADIKAHGGPSLLIIAYYSSNIGCVDLEMTSMLLSKGVDVNAVNRGGETPLSIAVFTAHFYTTEIDNEERFLNCVEIIRTLLDAGAKVDTLSDSAYNNMIKVLRKANNM